MCDESQRYPKPFATLRYRASSQASLPTRLAGLRKGLPYENKYYGAKAPTPQYRSLILDVPKEELSDKVAYYLDHHFFFFRLACCYQQAERHQSIIVDLFFTIFLKQIPISVKEINK